MSLGLLVISIACPLRQVSLRGLPPPCGRIFTLPGGAGDEKAIAASEAAEESMRSVAWRFSELLKTRAAQELPLLPFRRCNNQPCNTSSDIRPLCLVACRVSAGIHWSFQHESDLGRLAPVLRCLVTHCASSTRQFKPFWSSFLWSLVLETLSG